MNTVAVAIVAWVVSAGPNEPQRGAVLVERVIATVARRPIFLSEVREEAEIARALGNPPCAKDVVLRPSCWRWLAEAIIARRAISEEARRNRVPFPESAEVLELLRRLERALGGPESVRALRERYAYDERQFVRRLAQRLRADKLRAEHGTAAAGWLQQIERRNGVNRLVDVGQEPP